MQVVAEDSFMYPPLSQEIYNFEPSFSQDYHSVKYSKHSFAGFPKVEEEDLTNEEDLTRLVAMAKMHGHEEAITEIHNS